MNVPLPIIGQGAYDPAAQAYFTATGITSSSLKTAINQLVLDLKFNGLWPKMTAAYPFPTNDAAVNKVNLVNPGTDDIVWHGNLTHSTTGVLSDGSSGYGDTGISAPSLSQDSIHMSFYSRTNASGFTMAMGAYSSGAAKLTALSVTKASDSAPNWANSALANNIPNTGVTDTRGLFCVTRTGPTANGVYRNGSLVQAGTDTSVTMIALNLFVFARNDSGSPNVYSNKEGAWASIGSGLDATNNANLYTVVQAYQTALARQV